MLGLLRLAELSWALIPHHTLKATMPNLTKTQLEHAKTRIEQAKAAYTARLIAPFGERPKVPEYTGAEMIGMIRKGHATLKDTANNDRYCSLSGSFEYPRTPLMQKTQDELDAWEVHHNAITETADKLEQKLLDELIMSPDGAAALLSISKAFD